MKLHKIPNIKNYKSFQEFSWNKFFNAETFHDSMNIIYGENGSGKSSIVNILKSVSENKSFITYLPKEICLNFNSNQHKYSNNAWNICIDKEEMVFFDREFVDKNVHLGHMRDTQAGGQEQESGKMIIEFDSKAINLRDAQGKAKIEKEKEENNLQKFYADNREILAFSLSEEDKPLYKEFKDITKEETLGKNKQLSEAKKELDSKLKTDQVSKKKVENIQNSIEELEDKEIDIALSPYEDYEAIFYFDLKEQVKIDAEQTLIENLRFHKDFFETGLEIRKSYPNKCPFCQSDKEEENIKKVIKTYNDIFDDTYKTQLKQFADDKQDLIEELKNICEEVDNLNLNSIFIKLKELDQKYKIKDIYSVEEEKSHKKPQTKKIIELKNKLLKLKKPNNEDIKYIYNEAKKELETINKFIEGIEIFIADKNTIIRTFKTDNTDEKLQKRILETTERITESENQLTFFNEAKIKKQEKKEQKEKELEIIRKQSDEAREKHKKAKDAYHDYCSNEVFTKPLKKIEGYFDNFNFGFKLKLKTERTGNRIEFPFAFKVLDLEGNDRDLKEGLSEGELQVLSLCFFFAFIDIQRDKENKILVFDDPITSLDNSNLNYLVDLISKEQESFSQTFVFTHHRTFLKFLRKKFNEDCKVFNIIRNKKEFGGSFISNSKEEKFINKLKTLETHLESIAQNPDGFDIELKIVEYGQYLRYEVERFIKNNLLHWNVGNNFGAAIDGVKNNKKINNEDLDKIKSIYSFCNWTTSHVDVGDDHGLEQLKTKINDFLDIIDRNSP